MAEYVILLAVAIALSAFSNNAFGAAMIVAFGFIVNETFVRLTGIPDPWWFFAIADACCATLLILLDFGRSGAGGAGIYATQVIMHVAFYLGGQKDYNAYLDALYEVALIQLLVLGVGGIFGGGRLSRIMHRLRHMGGVGYNKAGRFAKRTGNGE